MRFKPIHECFLLSIYLDRLCERWGKSELKSGEGYKGRTEVSARMEKDTEVKKCWPSMVTP